MARLDIVHTILGSVLLAQWLVQATTSPTLPPIPENFWDTATIFDMYEHLLCYDTQHNPEHPNSFTIPNEEFWIQVRKIYRATVGEASTILPAEDEGKEPTDGTKPNSGFLIGTEIRTTRQHGRGNYVTEDVPNGTLIWRSKYTAQFDNQDQYRAFLKAIPLEYACDVINWSYTRLSSSDGNVVACVDMEVAGMINHPDNDEEPNIQLGNSENSFDFTGCTQEFYAKRDIPKGTELLIDYDFHQGYRGWVTMGLDEEGHDVDSVDDADDADEADDPDDEYCDEGDLECIYGADEDNDDEQEAEL